MLQHNGFFAGLLDIERRTIAIANRLGRQRTGFIHQSMKKR